MKENPKSVGSAGKKTIAPKSLGGPGIGSLHSANTTLLVKWWWRLKVEEEALWAKVVKAIHGVTGRDSNSFANRRRAGVWLNIAKTVRPFLL